MPRSSESVLLGRAAIQERVRELGARITRDYAGEDVRLVTVLKGGLFFLADLCRAIDLPVTLDFMAVSPYAPGVGGAVRVTKDLSDDVAGASVILVEDVVDTGLTVNYVYSLLKARGARASRSARCSTSRRVASRRAHRVPRLRDARPLPRRLRARPRRPLPEPALHRGAARRVGPAMSRRVVLPLGILVGVLVVGVAGYMLIEGWGFLDSLYMTVITVGTVGFSEVHPLSRAGEAFTMFMILAGVAALGFALAQFLEFLLEGHILGFLEGRRMEKRIAELSGHTIVAGAGRVGAVVARVARGGGRGLRRGRCGSRVRAETARDEGWPFVLGDATEEDTLQDAGIDRAGASSRRCPPMPRTCS